MDVPSCGVVLGGVRERDSIADKGVPPHLDVVGSMQYGDPSATACRSQSIPHLLLKLFPSDSGV